MSQKEIGALQEQIAELTKRVTVCEDEQYVPFLDTAYPEDPAGPDEIKPREDLWLWPTHKVVPFHNVHPVTGKPIQPERWQGDIDWEKAAK